MQCVTIAQLPEKVFASNKTTITNDKGEFFSYLVVEVTILITNTKVYTSLYGARGKPQEYGYSCKHKNSQY